MDPNANAVANRERADPVAYPVNPIFVDDIESMAPGQMMGSGPLFRALQALARARPNALVLNPEILSEVTRPGGGTAARQTLAQQVAARRAETRAGGPARPDVQVFFPMQAGLNHYVLAVAHFGDRTVRFYDSSDVVRRPGGQQRRRPARRLAVLRVVAAVLPPSAAAPWRRRFYHCPQQQNRVDCGVSVLLNALHLLHDPARTDLVPLPGLPRVPGSMYWIAARAAILELCRGQVLVDNAHDVAAATRELDAVAGRVAGEARRIAALPPALQLEQAPSLGKVIQDISALNVDVNDPLLEAIVTRLAAMEVTFARV